MEQKTAFDPIRGMMKNKIALVSFLKTSSAAKTQHELSIHLKFKKRKRKYT
jgi:hypothetical protein